MCVFVCVRIVVVWMLQTKAMIEPSCLIRLTLLFLTFIIWKALHILSNTDAFAPHRSSKTTTDRFDVRTLLDEEELERYGLMEH